MLLEEEGEGRESAWAVAVESGGWTGEAALRAIAGATWDTQARHSISREAEVREDTEVCERWWVVSSSL